MEDNHDMGLFFELNVFLMKDDCMAEEKCECVRKRGENAKTRRWAGDALTGR